MNTIFTFGYSRRSLADLLAAAFHHDAVVVDVRYKAMARAPEWRVGRLKAGLGPRYVAAGAMLGNVNYKNGGPIVLADEEGGLDFLDRQLEEGPAILLCACRLRASCHRRYIAERARDLYGVKVVDL